MRRRPFLLGLLALLSLTLVAGAAVPAGAGGSKPPAVPPAFKSPPATRSCWTSTGKGVQIYDCKPGTTGLLAWTFREPAAVLYGRGDRPVGIHFRGPTFESFDGSSVVGTLDGTKPRSPGRSPGCG